MTFSSTYRKLVAGGALALTVAAVAVPGASAQSFSNAGPTSGPTVGQLVTVDGPRAAGPTLEQLARTTKPGVIGPLVAIDGTLHVTTSLNSYSTDGPRAGGPVGADVNAYSHDGPRSGPATTLPPFSVDGPRTAPIALPLSAPVATGDGFDWADAGIGAGIGIGVSLLALLGVAVARRQRPLARV